MPSIKYWLWLSSMTETAAAARAALIQHYGDAETAYFAPGGEYRSIPGISERDAAILEKRDLGRTDGILSACNRDGIDIITYQDAGYPRRLKNIFAPPAVLYVKGRLPDVDNTPSIAVIGTRSASPYGIKMGMNIAYQISKCGGVVVSGLTEGIDRSAARGCLLAGGRCIGVLGTAHGGDNSLHRDVSISGALISEYPPGTKPQRSFFRDRNRISSGLSHGTVVVEAPEKSGSLLFARETIEQGRELFAVPGNADAQNSAGSNMLLKQGAKPVTCGWDVMCEFEHIYPDAVIRPRAQDEVPKDPEAVQTEQQTPETPNRQEPTEAKPSTKTAVDKQNNTAYIDLREQLAGLNEEQLKIIAAINMGETHIDDIIEASGLSTAKVLSQLTILEIKGYIRRSAGRRISLNTIIK